MNWLLVVVAVAACGTDRSYLETDQGPCTDLDEASCKADDRCQQAYEDSGFQPGPSPMRCLKLEAVVHSNTACDGLSEGDCRDRADCSPVYWQDLGPNDGPVGDPYFTRCADASQIGA